jgi:hypothetical protein
MCTCTKNANKVQQTQKNEQETQMQTVIKPAQDTKPANEEE